MDILLIAVRLAFLLYWAVYLIAPRNATTDMTAEELESEQYAQWCIR